MEWIQLLGTLLAILGGILGIAIIVRKRQLAVPKLSFDCGISRSMRKHLPRASRNKPSTTVTFGISEPGSKKDILFALPFFVENIGNLPLRNITLQLEYPAEYAAPPLEEVQQTFSGVIKLASAYATDRSTVRLGVYTQSRLEIGVLRPGEFILVAEPLALTPYHTLIHDDGVTRNYTEALRACSESEASFLALCPIRAFLYCEDIEALHRKIVVVWLKAENVKEAAGRLGGVVRGLWRGEYPKPGIHVKFIWENVILKELAHIIIPQFLEAPRSGGRILAIEKPLDSEMATIEILMPEKQPFGDLHEF